MEDTRHILEKGDVVSLKRCFGMPPRVEYRVENTIPAVGTVYVVPVDEVIEDGRLPSSGAVARASEFTFIR